MLLVDEAYYYEYAQTNAKYQSALKSITTGRAGGMMKAPRRG
jgi:hypothetical protein